MRPELVLLLIIGTAILVPLKAEDKFLQVLRNNPFSRPAVLKRKPPVTSVRAEVPAQEINLKVTATMVSATAPMAVVDGKLLAVGDSIKGMKLKSVRDGRVVFSRKGKLFFFEITYESIPK